MDRYQTEPVSLDHNYNPDTDPATTIRNNLSSDEIDDWPDWANLLQCISHFLLTLYSSITFPIFCVKQKPSRHIERFIQRIPFIQKIH